MSGFGADAPTDNAHKKTNRYGGSVIKVSTFETKASQFDHTDESYTKKKDFINILTERIRIIIKYYA